SAPSAGTRILRPKGGSMRRKYLLLAPLLVAGFVIGGTVAVAETPSPPPGKVTICHATGSASNPYVRITISEAALAAHRAHQDGRDIIPAPAGGCPTGPGTTTHETTTHETTTAPGTTTHETTTTNSCVLHPELCHTTTGTTTHETTTAGTTTVDTCTLHPELCHTTTGTTTHETTTTGTTTVDTCALH